MFRWMGEPPEFAGPELEKTGVRYKNPDLLPAIARLFSHRTRAELEVEGQGHGVPISGLQSFADCIAAEHMRVRGAFTERTLQDGTTIVLPNGMIAIDGERMGPGNANESLDVVWPAIHAEASALPLGIIYFTPSPFWASFQLETKG